MAIFSCLKFKGPATERPSIEQELIELIKTLFDAISRRDANSILRISAQDGVATLIKDASIHTTKLSEFLEELQGQGCHYRLFISDIKILIHTTQAMALVPYEAIFDSGHAYFGSISFVFMMRSGKWVVFSSSQLCNLKLIANFEAVFLALRCIS
jgi:hypothetical protein